jgi:hypothetical protein
VNQVALAGFVLQRSIPYFRPLEAFGGYMPTLLLSRMCQPEASGLAAVARAARWKYQWLNRRRPPRYLHGREFAFYGETVLGLRLMADHGLALLEPTFDLLTHLPYCFRRREVRLTTLGDALAITHAVFVKPADCTHKAFEAAVWKSGWHILCADDLSAETLVLVAEPVRWTVEFRVIVGERQVATFSPYIREGRRAITADSQWPYAADEAREVLAFCHEFLGDESIDLPPAFTLDIGQGLLGCELEKMLPVLSRACRLASQLTDGDRAWLIRRAAGGVNP